LKTIGNTELKQFSEEITDTCFVKVEKDNNTAVLFYKAGEIIDACLNGVYGKAKAPEIVNWKDAEYYKVKVDSVSKFQSEDLKYMFDIIEFNGISADIYIKQSGQIVLLSFSEGCLISVIPETNVTKQFIQEILNIKGKNIKMKLTGEKTGDIKIFISEILSE
jgi:hypothetical protein